MNLDALGYPAWLPATLEAHESPVILVLSAGLAHGVQDGIERHHSNIKKIILKGNTDVQFLLVFQMMKLR